LPSAAAKRIRFCYLSGQPVRRKAKVRAVRLITTVETISASNRVVR
jgi:hypothetical protein